MKKILCFGDSNTFGFIPGSGARYDANSRWTGVLATLAKGKFEIIEAGCNNRTCFSDNPEGEIFTGYKILPSLLSADLDCVVLALGINDLQFFFNPTLEEVQKGMENLIDIARKGAPKAKILVVAPSKILPELLSGYFVCQFDEVSIEKSSHIAEIYAKSARDKGCDFIDLEAVAKPSSKDGLHYDKNGHHKVAQAMYEKLSAFDW